MFNKYSSDLLNQHEKVLLWYEGNNLQGKLNSEINAAIQNKETHNMEPKLLVVVMFVHWYMAEFF